MATLGEITAEVLRTVEDHVDLVTAAIPQHVARAQLAIESRCAFAVQEAVATVTVTDGISSFALPEDFIAVRKQPSYLSRADSKRYSRLEEHPDFDELTLASEGGVPRYWTISGDATLDIWPLSDGNGPSLTPGGYDVRFYYWKSLPQLVVAGDENWWSQHMDDVLAFRAIAFVFADMRDPQANWWSATAAARFIEIRNQYKRNLVRQKEMRMYPSQPLSSRANEITKLRGFRRLDLIS
jgi:hypothetical protein